MLQSVVYVYQMSGIMANTVTANEIAGDQHYLFFVKSSLGFQNQLSQVVA
jgi:hypothetical protein